MTFVRNANEDHVFTLCTLLVNVCRILLQYISAATKATTIVVRNGLCLSLSLSRIICSSRWKAEEPLEESVFGIFSQHCFFLNVASQHGSNTQLLQLVTTEY